MTKNEELLSGRQLLSFQLPSEPPPDCLTRPAMTDQGKMVRCRRCNALLLKIRVQLPDGCYYCPNCLSLGRVTSDALLYHLPEANLFATNRNYLEKIPCLTPEQTQISFKLTAAMADHTDQLLWAVTGAGKTEMMFASLNYAFKLGYRVCWAAPRVDVILELAPRLQAAFPNLAISLLYGQESSSYQYRQFVLCTTHQLLRFYHAFDVLIIDEIDSFPFANNPGLNYAASQAVKPRSSQIYLSATPSEELRQKVITLYLPKRFHGHPLPVPKAVYFGYWRKKLLKKQLPRQVKKELEKGLSRNERYLIFVSEIRLLSAWSEAFQKAFPYFKWATVFAADPQRNEKITAFRQGCQQVLFTTTILERGVTISHINVLVLGAESPVFNWATLVQIAGRAGRDQRYYADRVIFYYGSYTLAIKTAIKQINHLNRRAGFNESM